MSAWGEDLFSPPGQSEAKPLEALYTNFADLFLEDHDSLGRRTKGSPTFVKSDNDRMVEDLEEPQGTWYHDPFSDPRPLWLTIEKYLDHFLYKRPLPGKVVGLSLPKSSWGSRRWHSEQTAKSARFDYIPLPLQGPKNFCLSIPDFKIISIAKLFKFRGKDDTSLF